MATAVSRRGARLLGLLCLTVLAGPGIASNFLHAQGPAGSSLPAPLPMPKGSPLDAALDLAQRVAAGGDDALPALLTALRASGFYVRDRTGRILIEPVHPPGMSLAFADWEVRLVTARTTGQPRIEFDSFSDSISAALPEMGKERIHAGLLDGLRKAAANSKNPDLQFWALFVIALGEVAPDGYCLTIEDTSAQPLFLQRMKTDADAVQRSTAGTEGMDQANSALSALLDEQMNEQQVLMDQVNQAAAAGDQARIKALSAQLQDLQKKYDAKRRALEQKPPAAAAAVSHAPIAEEYAHAPLSLLQVSLIGKRLAGDLTIRALRQHAKGAGTAPPLGPNAPADDGAADAQDSSASFDLGTLMDAAAVAFPEGFNQLAEYMAEADAAAGHDASSAAWDAYATNAARANAIFAAVKLFATYAHLEITITPDDARLERTKTQTAGEPLKLTLSAKVTLPENPQINAIRPALNLLGIDASMPDGGPVKNAALDWELTEGGAGGISQTAGPFGRAMPVDGYVEWAPGFRLHDQTDASGQAVVTLEGLPQREDLGTNAVAVQREAQVLAKLRLKTDSISQDIVDATGIVVNVKGGAGSYWINAIADMLNRSNLLSSKYKTIKVTDWNRPAWAGQYRISLTGSVDHHSDTSADTWVIDRYVQGSLWIVSPEDYQPGMLARLQPDGHDEAYHIDDRHEYRMHIPAGGEATMDQDLQESWKGPLQLNTNPFAGPLLSRPIIGGDVTIHFFSNYYEISFHLASGGAVRFVSSESGSADQSMSIGQDIGGLDELTEQRPIPADARELAGTATRTVQFKQLGTLNVKVEWQMLRQTPQ